MTYEILIAGFGGQGVMSMGMLLTYAGMLEGKYVSWIPSYGPEQRGGTANCAVVISDEEIGSPVVTEPTIAVIMNLPSLDKFEPTVSSEGKIFVNSSLIAKDVSRSDLLITKVPANDIAGELGADRIANMVMLGAVLAETRVVSEESIIESLKAVLPPHRHNLIPLNRDALERGKALVLAKE